MYPEPLFHVLDHGINLYILIRLLSALPALALALLLGRERDIPPTVVLDGLLIAVVAAVLGGSLLWSLIGLFGHAISGPWSLAGIVAVIGSLAIFVRFHSVARARAAEFMDVFCASGALALGLGRLGCLAAGCCYGKPAYGLPWAVTFSHPATACIYKGIPVHPTQLYQAAGNLVIFVALLVLWKRPAFRGALLWVSLLSYGLLRFVVEFYRGDVRPMVGCLSLSQVVCIAFVAIGGVMLARRFLASADVGRGESRFEQGTPAG
jgi:phosphatidylglycerol:prolipoprotein diacylglycerol transferase